MFWCGNPMEIIVEVLQNVQFLLIWTQFVNIAYVPNVKVDGHYLDISLVDFKSIHHFPSKADQLNLTIFLS